MTKVESFASARGYGSESWEQKWTPCTCSLSYTLDCVLEVLVTSLLVLLRVFGHADDHRHGAGVEAAESLFEFWSADGFFNN